MYKNEMTIKEENIIKTFDLDVLNRKPQLYKLIRLLNVIEDNYTISIDGAWGVGKTFFIEQLRYLYESPNYKKYFNIDGQKEIESFRDKYIPVYYNAWENDDHDNVIESLIFNLLDVVPKQKKKIFNNKKDYLEIVKPILSNIIERGSKGWLKKEIFDKIDSFDKLSESIITCEEKKQGLYKLFDLIAKENIRILLIIDELDRCKPDFSVKVLEAVKHFYNYSNITCLVVTNNNQLSKCIKHFYGNDFDGYGYLNKMYDTVLTLDVDENDLEDYLDKYLNFSNDSYLSKEMSYLLIKYYNFNLRECNTFVNMYRMSVQYINFRNLFSENDNVIYSNIFLPLGLALKVNNIEEFNFFIKGKSEKTIKNFVEYMKRNDINNKYLNWLTRIIKIGKEENIETKMIELYKKAFNQSRYGTDYYPIQEALSLLGNNVSYDEEKKND